MVYVQRRLQLLQLPVEEEAGVGPSTDTATGMLLRLLLLPQVAMLLLLLLLQLQAVRSGASTCVFVTQPNSNHPCPAACTAAIKLLCV